MSHCSNLSLTHTLHLTGVLNTRSPAPDYEWVSGNQSTGLAYETIVALANELNLSLWINVPHLASDDFIRNLALLILYGSDGVTPYQTTVENPIYPPLSSHLELFVEYSNEIWSAGPAFAQGEWSQTQAESLGITKAQFNARRFCHAFSIFQSVWSDNSDRLVRVAATWSSADSYTSSFLDEMTSVCPLEVPSVSPDCLAITTYFGNGIQDYVWAQGESYFSHEMCTKERNISFEVLRVAD